MNILVIGSGGREHALCWKIKQDKSVTKLYCAPGNAGIAQVAECVSINAEGIDSLLQFAEQNKIDLTIVGPEVPLVMGIVDKFNAAGLRIFGPDAKGAQLEGSKVFSKAFMLKYNIPTAAYFSFTNADEAIASLEKFNLPLVIKADGLAAGKGVVICTNYAEAENAIIEMMEQKKFDAAGEKIVIEEFLDGFEGSLLCFVAGHRIIPMQSARDYKRAFDDDKGLNTGGMGNYSPNHLFTPELDVEIREKILTPIEKGLQSEQIDYRGVLFIGIMVTSRGAKVLEFNVRFGDPETQVVIPRIENNLVDIIEKTIDGTLIESDIRWSNNHCVTVISASDGYPEKYEKGKQITGLENVADDVIIFHAGTKFDGENIVTNGGRVLAVTAMDSSLEKAREKIYAVLKEIHFDGMFYRNDIGKI